MPKQLLGLMIVAVVSVSATWDDVDERWPRYDPKREATVTGTVVEVRDQTEVTGRWGVHVTLRSGDAKLDVHFGPAWFLDEKGLAFAKDDALEVFGSRITLDGVETLIAREVKRGDLKLKLRDASGRPLWAGRRGRRGGSE